MIDNSHLDAKLKRAIAHVLHRKGWTQQEIATYLRISRQSVAKHLKSSCDYQPEIIQAARDGKISLQSLAYLLGVSEAKARRILKQTPKEPKSRGRPTIPKPHILNQLNADPASQHLNAAPLSDTERALIQAARAVRAFAYAPYSNYAVGAAVLTDDQRIVSGCNVENASYGLSICAERAAVFNAIASGARNILAVAVCTPDGGTPCGACRQVLLEFAPEPDNCPVWVVKPDAIVRRYTLAELLPHAFRLL
ncbi:MAG: cytidine deaminase [Armatimonadetes bacterium JP3_11]|jgi:cytidine deaminase|nr:MAG: cytidine deaminase [Armatimonadetes bacterium CP1_7O]OYT75749.1 MAG: cytidine deaminase [Armatimonadetes bacterium JP3_11]RMH09410.1 MAG: cytidine deaminase [Armatimonadota bacterium]